MNVTVGIKKRTATKNKRISFAIAAVVAIAVTTGGYVLLRTGAAGFFAATEAANGTVSGNARVISDAGAASGKAVQFTAPATPPPPTPMPTNCITQVWQQLEACGWPGTTNTGPVLSQCPGGVLTANSGGTTRTITITTPGTVISCQNITGGLVIKAQNVTIKNSKVSFDGGGAGGSGVININDGASATVDHVEVDGLNHTHACIWDEGAKGSGTYSMKAVAVNCHNVNDGIFSWWWSKDANLGAGSDFLIQDSYFHDFTQNAANGHIDGYQTEGAANGTITHNTFKTTEAAGAPKQSGGGLDSAIALWDSWNQDTSPTGKVTTNITVSNNLITGGGFAVYAEDYSPDIQGSGNGQGGNSLTNVHFTNNKFSTSYNRCVGDFGVWFYRSSWTPYFGGPTDGWNAGGSSRTGNTILETGASVDNGNPTSCG